MPSFKWKGGISSLNNYMRDRLRNWITESMAKFDYKCALTSTSRNIEVHHFYNFSNILEESLTNLKLINSKTGIIGDYSENELKLINDECIKLHYQYGFGIPVNKKIHKLFHELYGRKNNTKEQFIEFLYGFNNTTHEDFLKAEKMEYNPSSFLFPLLEVSNNDL